MGFAEAANLPVVIVADIDRGGAIAALVGTQALLDFTERMRVKGFIVNKFRGDIALFEPALTLIAGRTGWQSFGVLPWFAGAARLPAEIPLRCRTLALSPPAGGGPEQLDSRLRGNDKKIMAARPIKIAVPRLARIANFDDFDPLRRRARCRA